VRYVRFDFLTYYGHEYFCPLSLIRVHGRTMMDEYIEDEGKMEEEIVIETPPSSSYLQSGHPFLTLPSSSKPHDSDLFEDVFPFLSSNSFLRDISSENESRGHSHNGHHTTTYSSSSSTSSKPSSSSSSSSSNSSKHGHSEKVNPNINLFSLFIKQYNQLLTKENEYHTYESKNKSTSTSSKDIDEEEEEESVEEKSNNDENNDDSNDENEDKTNSDNNGSYQPPLHENVFKTIMRRLTALERNTTLSFKYLEEQGKIFNQYILYLHKKQQSSLKQLIEDNNMMYDNNLHALVIVI